MKHHVMKQELFDTYCRIGKAFKLAFLAGWTKKQEKRSAFILPFKRLHTNASKHTICLSWHKQTFLDLYDTV